MSGPSLEDLNTTQEDDTTLLIQVKPKNSLEGQSLSKTWTLGSRTDGKHMSKVTPLQIPERVDTGRGSESMPIGPMASQTSYTIPMHLAPTGSTDARGLGPSSSSKLSRLLSARASIVHNIRIRMRTTGWYDSQLAVGTRKFLRGRTFLIITMVCLLFALFLSDVFAVCEVKENTAQDIILTAVLTIFLMEFFGLLLTDASYLFGFFFFMDLLGTASMIFDISFLLGTDATEPERRSPDGGKENIIVVRAARATKLGARAGRLSRVLKLLRFMPFLKNDMQDNDVQMAKKISSQLMNVISTRVAFLSICIVIVLPFLGMFTYPEVDDSMMAWTQLLSVNAVDYYNALSSSPQVASLVDAYQARMNRELQRFAKFYSSYSYGPFKVSYLDPFGHDLLQLDFTTSFEAPARKSMIREVTNDSFRASFDLSTPKQLESIANITLIVFTALTMIVFGLVTSSSISTIALNPLERMLFAVREQCREIFKYTDEFKDLKEAAQEDNDEEDYEDDDKAESSEFVLLEKVVKKLTAIAQLAVKSHEPQARDDMGEDEIAALNWGGQGPQATPSMRHSQHIARDSKANFRFSLSSDEAAEVPRNVSQLSADEIDLPDDVLDALQTEFFDAFVTPEDGSYSLIAVSIRIVQHYEGSESWLRSNVKENQLMKFMELVEGGYKPNPYHNFNHALDVLYTVARWMWLIEAHLFLTEISQFWVMIASIGHDLGHIAVNNQYLIETKDEIALRYNDRSPLENMHCAKLFQIFQSDSEADIFSQIEKDVYREMRKGIIQAILHTDFTKHGEMVKELGLFYHTNYEIFDQMEPSARFVEVLSEKQQLMINMLVHGADISNPMRPWDICYKYAQLIVEEFFNQGDLEATAGIPIQALNNRHTVNIPNSQVGFIEFLITPMAESMVNIFSPLDGLAENLASNIQSWQRLWIADFKPEEEAIAKVKARVERVTKKCNAVTRAERRKSSRVA